LAIVALAASARAGESAGLDWQVEEAPAGPALGFARGVRDGVLGLADDMMDVQLAFFSEFALDAGEALALGSDAIGLVDDNPVTQHVLKATASKSLAKTAWLFHLSGSEAILGSHGLEAETWLSHSLTQLNPLLDPEEESPRLPLEATAFVGEALLHGEVYTSRIPGSVLVPALAADLVVRPVGNLVRIAGFHSAADEIEDWGNGLVRASVR
jgi:hypothetical protein